MSKERRGRGDSNADRASPGWVEGGSGRYLEKQAVPVMDVRVCSYCERANGAGSGGAAWGTGEGREERGNKEREQLPLFSAHALPSPLSRHTQHNTTRTNAEPLSRHYTRTHEQNSAPCFVKRFANRPRVSTPFARPLSPPPCASIPLPHAREAAPS